MELARGMQDESPVDLTGSPATTGPQAAVIPAEHGREEPETTTALLRRCTALAARARVELLAPRPSSAAAELGALLERLEGEGARLLREPDPIMTALTAAALQDLVQQLRAPGGEELARSAQTVLEVLRGAMEGTGANVPA